MPQFIRSAASLFNRLYLHYDQGIDAGPGVCAEIPWCACMCCRSFRIPVPWLRQNFHFSAHGSGRGRGCLSPALKLGPTSPAPRVRWSIRGDPPTLVRRILTSSTSRRRQQRALHPAEACSVGALAVLRLPPWRRGHEQASSSKIDVDRKACFNYT